MPSEAATPPPVERTDDEELLRHLELLLELELLEDWDPASDLPIPADAVPKPATTGPATRGEPR